MKKTILSLICASLLFGCGFNSSTTRPTLTIDSSVNYPYIEIERNTELTETIIYPGEYQYVSYLTPLTVSDYKEKLNNDDDFVILYHQETCGPCKIAITEVLNPLIKNDSMKIYSVESTSKNYKELAAITENTKFSFEYTPSLYFIKGGEFFYMTYLYSYFEEALRTIISVSPSE